MRKSKEVILAGMEPVAMREMTVAHFPAAIRILKELVRAGDVTIDQMAGLVLDHYGEILEVLVDCSSLSAEQFREVGASDLLELIKAWAEANESFFDQVKQAVGRAMKTPLAPSKR